MSSITPGSPRPDLSSSSSESLKDSTSLTPPATPTPKSDKPVVQIETPDGGPMSVLVTVNGETFRLSKVSLGTKEIDLNSIELKAFAEKVGQLAKKLIKETEIPAGKKAFSVTVESLKDEDENTEILVGLSGEKDKEAISGNEKIVELFDEVDKRTHHIIKGRQGVHAVSKDFSDRTASRTKQYVRKQAFRIGALLSAPITLPVMTVIGAGMLVKAGVDKLRGKGAIREATKTMQQGEERAKAEAWGETGMGFHHTIATKAELERYFKSEISRSKTDFLMEKLQNRVEAALDRTGYDESEIKKIIKILSGIEEFYPHQFKDAANLKNTLQDIFQDTDVMQSISDKEIREIVEECKLFQLDGDELTKQIASDAEKWESFITLVQKDKDTITDPQKHNLEMVKKFREVLASSTYQAFKDDPFNEYVKRIHQFAVANYNEVMALDPYHDLGKALQADREGNIPETGDLNTSEARAEFVDRIVAGHERVTSENLTDHGYKGLAKLPYGILNPVQALGSIASLSTQGGWGHNLSQAFGLGGYDPASVSNNQSLQGTTTSEVVLDNGSKIEMKINNCYGGSPTVGHQIAPEFLAVLQAIRNNNNIRRLDERRADPKIPSVLTYTNLQKIHDNGGEGERSFVLMQLAERFKREFVGVSLSKDSNFYLLKNEYASDSDHNQWVGPNVFGLQMRQVLSNDACYTYMDRRGKNAGEGIYLPGGKEAWEPVLDKIFEIANETFHGSSLDTETSDPSAVRENRFAYQELVYSLIEAYVEEKAGINAPGHFVMAIRACKENIDRGGGENAKYLYSLLGKNNDHERLSLVSGVFESRALASRDRVIIQGRMPPILAYMKHVSPEMLQSGIESLFDAEFGVLEVLKHEYQPATLAPTRAIAPVSPAAVEEERELEDSFDGLRFLFERVENPPTPPAAPITEEIPTEISPILPQPPSSSREIIVEGFVDDDDVDDDDDGRGVFPASDRIETDLPVMQRMEAIRSASQQPSSIDSDSPMSVDDLPPAPQPLPEPTLSPEDKRNGFLRVVSNIGEFVKKLFSSSKGDRIRENALLVEGGEVVNPTELHVAMEDGKLLLRQEGEISGELYGAEDLDIRTEEPTDRTINWSPVGVHYVKMDDIQWFFTQVSLAEIEFQRALKEAKDEEGNTELSLNISHDYNLPNVIDAETSTSTRLSIPAPYKNYYVRFQTNPSEVKYIATAYFYTDSECKECVHQDVVRVRENQSKKIGQELRADYAKVGIYYVNEHKMDKMVKVANHKRGIG